MPLSSVAKIEALKKGPRGPIFRDTILERVSKVALGFKCSVGTKKFAENVDRAEISPKK